MLLISCIHSYQRHVRSISNGFPHLLEIAYILMHCMSLCHVSVMPMTLVLDLLELVLVGVIIVQMLEEQYNPVKDFLLSASIFTQYSCIQLHHSFHKTGLFWQRGRTSFGKQFPSICPWIPDHASLGTASHPGHGCWEGRVLPSTLQPAFVREKKELSQRTLVEFWTFSITHHARHRQLSCCLQNKQYRRLIKGIDCKASYQVTQTLTCNCRCTCMLK